MCEKNSTPYIIRHHVFIYYYSSIKQSSNAINHSSQTKTTLLEMAFSRVIYDKIRLEAKWVHRPSWEIDNIINTRIRSKYGDKCNTDGFVYGHSIVVTHRSAGMLDCLVVDGAAIYEVVFVATICSPKRGEIIECSVIAKHNEGIQCRAIGARSNDPLDIVMPIEWHVVPDTVTFLRNTLKVKDTITVEVIGTRYQPGDRNIRLVVQYNGRLSKRTGDRTSTSPPPSL